jgi:hypothetical protein
MILVGLGVLFYGVAQLITAVGQQIQAKHERSNYFK